MIKFPPLPGAVWTLSIPLPVVRTREEARALIEFLDSLRGIAGRMDYSERKPE